MYFLSQHCTFALVRIKNKTNTWLGWENIMVCITTPVVVVTIPNIDQKALEMLSFLIYPVLRLELRSAMLTFDVLKNAS